MVDKAVDRRLVGERVRAAREQAGMNQIELAELAAVSQATVSRIESGTRTVSLVEADRIASALGFPLDTLLYGSQVADRVLVALRVPQEQRDARPDVAPGVALLELDERLDHVVEGLRQHPARLPVNGPKQGPMAARGAQLAADLRAFLDLGTAPVADLAQLVEEVAGVDVATMPLPGVSGMCLVDEARSTTLLMVNSAEPAERQRFTLAHELGHVLFGDGAHIDLLDGSTGQKETRCNEFARNFLVPTGGIAAWLMRTRGEASFPVSDEDLGLLARQFLVSSEVVRIQLTRMGLRDDAPVPSTPTLASRQGWRQEYEAHQQAHRRPRPPRRLVERATAAFAAGRLGASMLARLEGRSAEDIAAEREVLEGQPGQAPLGAAPRPRPRPENLADVDRILAGAGRHLARA